MTVEEADRVLSDAIDMHQTCVRHLRAAQALERLASELLLKAIQSRKTAEGGPDEPRLARYLTETSNVIELNWSMRRDVES